MGREDENFGVFIKGEDHLEEEEEEGEEDEDEDDVVEAGDNYYSSVGSFLVYEEEFNTVVGERSDTQRYKELCKSFSDVFFSSSYPIDRCCIIAKYLHHIKLEKDENKDDRCKYLNYLLNTKEDFKSLTNYRVSKLLKAYNKLSFKFKTCNQIIEHIKNDDILGKIEKLHALHKSLGKLEKSIDDNDGHIYSNAEEFATLYRNYRKNCKDADMEGFCGELKKIELYCSERVKSEKYTEASEILKTLIPNDGTSTIVSCITMLAIPLFLYILYKFTPFGPWVNTKILKKKNIKNNLYQESQLQNPRDQQLNLQNSKYNIKYHTA
ncbi:PIR Superfamily Protein [Plasmodium ovale wallikeri]|uniref:PIR Superfamily Protein n=1 Tax=Plasmodium ovale wallikeri TaxID=864142 RepID=A0A1A9AT45_PLAOA|nr:PIR Superfamily Protein [Plasmodium ovale wallikeri]